MEIKKIKCILDVLSQAGLVPYLHHNAQTGSVYIKFRKCVGGTLRIADHKQRKRYSYRWNLRSDIKSIKTVKKGHDCYYYNFDNFEDMVGDMIKELNKQADGKNIMANLVRNA